MHLLASAMLIASVAGCPGSDGAAPGKADDRKGARAEGKPDAKKDAKTEATPDAKADAKTDARPTAEGPLGKLLEGPLPIAALIGKPPGEVEPQLGEALGKGMARESCVRYLPDRTWFRCAFALQRYGDKSGAYKAIGVEYEDGKATALAFDGLLKQTGAFDPRQALSYVGLELPGEPKVEEPEPGTTVYSWFNASSRLLIDGLQYRVVVSSIGGDWARTKVELILNHPLTEAQQAAVLPTGAGAQK